jgi:hypothetical protein
MKIYLFLVCILVSLPISASEDHSWMIGKEVRFDDPRGDILNVGLTGTVINVSDNWITVHWMEGGWPLLELWHNDTMGYEHIRSIIT